MSQAPSERQVGTGGPDYDFTAESDVPSLPTPRISGAVAQQREHVRGRVALALITLLVGLELALILVAVLAVHPFDRDVFALLLTGLLNPVVALVGTVLGFYFGEKAGKDTRN